MGFPIAIIAVPIAMILVFIICSGVMFYCSRKKMNAQSNVILQGASNVAFNPHPQIVPPPTTIPHFYNNPFVSPRSVNATAAHSLNQANHFPPSPDLPPAYSETPVYSTPSSGQAPSIDPPMYQSYLDQSTLSEHPSMNGALWTSSKLSIPNAVNSSGKRVTSWDSARGDSIESRPNPHSSSDYHQDLTLGPLDERIESDSEGDGEVEDLSGRWLEGLKKGKTGGASKGNTSSASKNYSSEPKSSKSTHPKTRRKRHNEGEDGRSGEQILSSRSSYRRKSSRSSQKSTKSKSQTSRTDKNSRSRNGMESFDSGLGHVSHRQKSSSRTKRHEGRENLAFDRHTDL